MKLDIFSRAKLLDKAKKLKLTGVNDSTSKTSLIQALQPLVDADPSIMDDMLTTVTTVNPTVITISSDEKQWSAYLKKFGVTPAQFLERYPNHPFKSVIAKLQK